MQFFNEVNPLLKEFIRYYWYVNGEESESSTQRLLPMDHVDLIIAKGRPFFYGANERMFQPKSIHFHGIRESSILVTQSGKIESFGISFTPWGFYCIVKQSMSQYVNKIVNLCDVNHLLSEELSAHMVKFNDPSKFIKSLESSLLKFINVKAQEELDFRVIEELLEADSTNVKEYCESNEISKRRLERIFQKYIGISPKRFMNIVRFEESSRAVMYSKESSLTDISYKNGYYDQPHFTKVFKGYTNYSPRDFQSEKPALKSHLDYE